MDYVTRSCCSNNNDYEKKSHTKKITTKNIFDVGRIEQSVAWLGLCLGVCSFDSGVHYTGERMNTKH